MFVMQRFPFVPMQHPKRAVSLFCACRLKRLSCVGFSYKKFVNDIIIMKSLDPLRANKIFIREELGHTAVSAIKASSVTL